MPEHLKKLLEDLAAAAVAANISFIGVLAAYPEDGSADFSTRLRLMPNELANVGTKHILLDCLREIMVEWSNASHMGQLRWCKEDAPGVWSIAEE